MNREQFLKSLENGLKKLPQEECDDILHDFEEHFSNGLTDGKTEEQISDALGSPKQIAKELVAASHIEKMEATPTTGNIFRAVWAVIGLGFFCYCAWTICGVTASGSCRMDLRGCVYHFTVNGSI